MFFLNKKNGVINVYIENNYMFYKKVEFKIRKEKIENIFYFKID